ncbi:MAG TPA: lamin tail domain-containing protein [Candidatus Acidoferrum sp.]|nr:lamin tail domain-containing protein [Candidatus Acidoferrum sp.]
MKHVVALLLLLTLIGAFGSSLTAAVVVNEVMANEPGGNTTLEWIELYNDGAASADLSFYWLQIGSTQVVLSGTMVGNSYMIVCRKLFSSGGTPGFEEYWGNNSGVWGDSPLEQYSQPIVASFSLTNTAGNVQLYRAGVLTSELSWTQAGRDGYSWERVSPLSSQLGQSTDPSGSTPGRLNSLTPLPDELSIDSVDAVPLNGETALTFLIKNVGLTTQTGRTLSVYYFNSVDTLNQDSLIFRDSLPSTDTGFTTVVRRTITLPGTYAHLGAALDVDDRILNNERSFMAPGAEYPPVILSEIMAAPTGSLASEWIELVSRYSGDISLQGWQIGVGQTKMTITNSPVTIGAGQYTVTAEDSTAFRNYYPQFSGQLIQPASWATLNNNGDTIRLIDAYGIQADSFMYSSTYDSNYTWGRSEDSEHRNDWGKSAAVGGSPGAPNDVVLRPTGSNLVITIEPQIFSPDGDGVDDATSIIIEAPQAKSYTMKIYDRKGRVVRTFADDNPLIRGQYEWDGRSDGGERLPIGIYILYFEANGVQSVKKTIVIAR